MARKRPLVEKTYNSLYTLIGRKFRMEITALLALFFLIWGGGVHGLRDSQIPPKQRVRERKITRKILTRHVVPATMANWPQIGR